MKYLSIIALAALAIPVAMPAQARCNLRDSNANWVYYSVAGGANPYTLTCALTIQNGTISNGQCVSSSGQSLTASGTLTLASTSDDPGHHHGGDDVGHRSRNMSDRPLKSVDNAVCTVTGTISYPAIGLTETLTNLTISHDRDQIVGVGNNGTGLLSVTFLNSRS
jgi:hypothetical protein